MSRILFTWELGANYGHLTRQLPVARELRRRGHEVLFAVADLSAAQELLALEQFAFVAAPVPPMRRPWPEDSVTYAEILARSGFGELPALRAATTAWTHLFEMYRPEVMLADHAPLSLFAAYLACLPVVHVAIGFELPPANPLLPTIREWCQPDREAVARLEKTMLDDMNRVCAERGRPPMASLGALFATEVPLLATFPELDHFPWRKDGRFVGPILARSDGAKAQWPQGDGPRIFVYHRADASLSIVLEALIQRNARVIAVVPGIDEATRGRFASDRIHLYTQPVELSTTLQSADLAVIPGGHGMICSCLLAGVPMLMLPVFIEQMLVTRCAERIGAGVGLGRDTLGSRLEITLSGLLGDMRFQEAARRFGAKYRHFDQVKVIDRLANTVERLPAASKKKSRLAAQSQTTAPVAASLH